MRTVCLTALILLATASASIRAEVTPAQRRMAREIGTAIQQAGKHFAASDFDQAGQAIEAAMQKLQEAVDQGTPESFDALALSIKRIEKAHTMLEFEGVSLPPFVRPTRPLASLQPMKGEPAPTTPGTPTNVPGVSFTQAVAPILVNRCGRCHVTAERGRFSMASYAALMKGPPEGVVVFAGDTVGSRLIETIETGDMPRGGGRVSPQELQTLKQWILAGAKFDGTDPNAALSAGATPTPSSSAAPTLTTRRASGKETVSFRRRRRTAAGRQLQRMSHRCDANSGRLAYGPFLAAAARR